MTSWIDNVAGASERFSYKNFERRANVNAVRLALTKLGATTPVEMSEIFQDLILMAKCGSDREFADRLTAFWMEEFVIPVEQAEAEREMQAFVQPSQLTAAERRGEQ